ncbi:hypothetical protein Taro_004486, partial [Colocasia esculenta]|nr:hypothetical protein [Colocasia esculenta]
GEGGTEGRRRGRDRWGWGICRCAARRRHIFTSCQRCISAACCLQASSLFRRHLKKGDHDPSANPHPMKRASLVPRCCFWLNCLFWGRSSYASVGPFSAPKLVDLNGATSSIKPQQITYIIPGIKDLDHTEIIDFVQKAHDLMVYIRYG